jgi:nicotinate-nucleotide pyrophosphorylase (carboxylating)
MSAPLYALQYDRLVRDALRQDLGRAGDLTTDAIVPRDQGAEGAILVRREGRIAGLEVALSAFRQLDPEAHFRILAGDGSDASAAEIVAYVRASARALLSAERVALNLLGRLSGIATATRDVVRRIEGTGAAIVCTRKTTPGLRGSRSTRCGGGRATIAWPRRCRPRRMTPPPRRCGSARVRGLSAIRQIEVEVDRPRI